jgi:hypothetical protein
VVNEVAVLQLYNVIILIFFLGVLCAYALVVIGHSHGAGSNQFLQRKRYLEDYRLRQWFCHLGSQLIAESQLELQAVILVQEIRARI